MSVCNVYCVCVYAYEIVYARVYVYVCMCVRTSVHMHVHACVRACACYPCVRVRRYLPTISLNYTPVHTYIHTYNLYIHTYHYTCCHGCARACVRTFARRVRYRHNSPAAVSITSLVRTRGEFPAAALSVALASHSLHSPAVLRRQSWRLIGVDNR